MGKKPTPIFDSLSSDDRRFIRTYVRCNFNASLTAKIWGYKGGSESVIRRLKTDSISKALEEYQENRVYSGGEIKNRFVNTARFDVGQYVTINGRRVLGEPVASAEESDVVDHLLDDMVDALESSLSDLSYGESIDLDDLRKRAKERNKGLRKVKIGVDVEAIVKDGYGYMIKSVKYTRAGDPIIEFRDAENALVQLARIQGLYKDTDATPASNVVNIDLGKMSTEQLKELLKEDD